MIIYNKFISFKGFCAMNIFGIIFARKEYKPISKTTINHENIHTAQMKELFYIPFYLWYFIEWLLKIFKYKRDAYYNISFEKEAYNNQLNYNYLKSRKKFSWFKLI